MKISLGASLLMNENILRYCIVCRKYIEDSNDLRVVGIEHVNGIHPILLLS